MDKWEVVMSMPSLHKAQALWFSGNIGIVFGNYRSLDDLTNKDILAGLEKKQAFIIRTLNNGKSWDKVFQSDGEINSVSYRKGQAILYALGRKYYADAAWVAFLLQSSNLGETWSALELPTNNIIGIDFSNERIAYAWSDTALFKTLDSARSWTRIDYIFQITPNDPKPVVGANGELWAISSGRVIKIEQDDKFTETALPRTFKVDGIDLKDGKFLWIIGRAQQIDGSRTVLYEQDGRNYREIAKFDHFLTRAFFLAENNVFLLGSDMTEVPPLKIFVYSRNMGKSWEREELKISDMMGPVFFNDENAIWVCGSAGRIQKRMF